MPELPDVEIFKKYMDATSLHHKINDVAVIETKVLEGVSARKLRARLVDRSFESTRRHGKYLFARLEERSWLVFHFGMTGALKYYKTESDHVKYVRVRFFFSNGYDLVYISQRMLGRIRLVPFAEEFIGSNEWGPDALAIDYGRFAEAVRKSRGPIKTTLMNQKLIAGIGNIYADEILFQSRLHPTTPGNKMKPQAIENLFHNVKTGLKQAIQWRADPGNFPKGHLLPHRNQGADCPVCGQKLKTVKVAGRTAYFCPRCQAR